MPRRIALAALTGLFACALARPGLAAPGVPATASPASAPADSGRRPVLLVHGIDDTEAIFTPLKTHLRRLGRSEVHAINLLPNNGDRSLPELAEQVASRVAALRRATGAKQVDLVGFSMGGMVSRYYLQRLGGLAQVRHFVIISSPQAGTFAAYFRWNPGADNMRFGSSFLRDLARDADTLAQLDTTVIWSPFDLMILPSWSSRLPGVHERVFPVLAHPWMVSDERVMQAIGEAIAAP